jgi:hypothetical protein
MICQFLVFENLFSFTLKFSINIWNRCYMHLGSNSGNKTSNIESRWLETSMYLVDLSSLVLIYNIKLLTKSSRLLLCFWLFRNYSLVHVIYSNEILIPKIYNMESFYVHQFRLQNWRCRWRIRTPLWHRSKRSLKQHVTTSTGDQQYNQQSKKSKRYNNIYFFSRRMWKEKYKIIHKFADFWKTLSEALCDIVKKSNR